MSLFTRRATPRHQARSYGGYFSSSNQLVPTRPPMATAGVAVTSTTAIQKVALMAATNLVANMPNLLDAEGFTGSNGSARQVNLPPSIIDPEGQGYGLADFGYKYLQSKILRGNAFVRVDGVDSNGRPSLVSLLNPDEVQAKRDVATGKWEFFGLDGKPMPRFGTSALVGGMIHRRSFAQPGYVLGLSVIQNHARTLGLALASEQFGADYFADGAHPTGILTSDQAVTPDQAKTIKDRFVNAIRGSREPAFLGAGAKYQQISVNPNESQFLETQKFTAAECCRMVGPGIAEMLGYETGGSMTYQNVEARSLHLLIYAIDPWLRDLEGLLSLFLPTPRYMKFDRSGILRMTDSDRWLVYATQLKNGARVINEVRADERMASVEWGDVPFLPAIAPRSVDAEPPADAIDGTPSSTAPTSSSQGAL